MGVRDYHRHSKAVCNTERWQRVRQRALRRDNYQCVKCQAHGKLEVDHIEPVRDAPELAYVMVNLQTLCKTCHTYKTRRELGQKTPEVSVQQIRNRRYWRSLVSDLETNKQPRTRKPCLTLSKSSGGNLKSVNPLLT